MALSHAGSILSCGGGSSGGGYIQQHQHFVLHFGLQQQQAGFGGSLTLVLLLLLAMSGPSVAVPAAHKLYNRFFGSSTNSAMRTVRPTDGNHTQLLTVYLGLQLSQLIDVDEKNQIMTTNVWLRHLWYDGALRWDPSEHDGVDRLYIPPDQIWLPDMVLYNNADGNYVVTLMTKVTVKHDGRITWEPPAIFKSSCQIDVEFFPFDEQLCTMKFGVWTHDGLAVDLQHLQQFGQGYSGLDTFFAKRGIELENYYESVEWDVTDVPVQKNIRVYPCCPEPYPDLTFTIRIRRKTLFYTVNLIVPCVAISFLTTFVFYLPSDSGEKITLSVSILLALTVFFLLLAEIIPPTSLVVPLIGKYLLFTMVLVTLSIVVTVIVLNVHFCDPMNNQMSPWVRRLFLSLLPRVLFMQKPAQKMYSQEYKNVASAEAAYSTKFQEFHKRNANSQSRSPASVIPNPSAQSASSASCDPMPHAQFSPHSQVRDLRFDIVHALEGVEYITEHIKFEDFKLTLQQEWHYVAMVMDRIFLIVFSVAVLLGTVGIIFQAPNLFHKHPPVPLRPPLDLPFNASLDGSS